MASLIRIIQTGLAVSLLFLLQVQLNFLHLENNAEDDMSAQTPASTIGTSRRLNLKFL